MTASPQYLTDEQHKASPALIGVLIVSMVAINVATHAVVISLRLPIFMDSIGIIVGAILAGPIVAAIIGVATTLTGTIIDPTLFAFSGTAIVIGLLAGFLARAGMFRSPVRAIGAGLVIAIAAAIVSAPVVVKVFGGATAGGSSALIAFFRATGDTIWGAVTKTSLTSEPIDKTIVSVLAWTLCSSLPNRVLALFPGARERTGRLSDEEGRKQAAALAGIMGFVAGLIVAFFLRPAAAAVGQLPLATVLSRGAGVAGANAVVIAAAKTSFNYLVAGAVGGALGGVLLVRLFRKKGSA